jgi:ATP-binding protein involved in chromosome partitioning
MEVPILGVIENMSYLELPNGEIVDVFGRGGGEQLAEESEVPFLGAIPMDPTVRVSGDQGKPIVLTHPESSVSLGFKAVMDRLLAQLESEQTLTAPNIEISD